MPPSITMQRAVDHRGAVAREVDDEIRHLLGPSQAWHQMRAEELLLHHPLLLVGEPGLVVVLLHHRRVGVAGRVTDDPRVLRRELDRHHARELDQARLGRPVGAAHRVTDHASDRGGVDDHAAARFLQQRRRVLRAHPWPAQVDPDHLVPDVLRQLVALGRRREVRLVDAGVVVEDVELPERVDRRGHQALHVLELRDVAVHEHGLPTGCLDLRDDRLRRLVRHVGDDDARALLRHPAGRGGADSLAGAGNDRDLALEHHRSSPLNSRPCRPAARLRCGGRRPAA